MISLFDLFEFKYCIYCNLYQRYIDIYLFLSRKEKKYVFKCEINLSDY